MSVVFPDPLAPINETRNRSARDASGVAYADSARATPAALPAEGKREQEFQRAKTAAAQRAATTLSAVDSVGADYASGSVRRIGARTFALIDGVWTDARYAQTMRTVRVKPYSAAYFALLERLDDLRAPFALMGASGTPGVVVAGRSVAIALSSEGAETLGARDMAAIEAGW